MRFSRFVILSILLIACAGLLFGQAENGAITGTVTDASGAVLANAKVTAVSINTNLTRSSTTTPSGEYTITSLKPDIYEVTVEAAGFSPYKTRVTVQVGAKIDVPAKLDVAAKTTTVEVTASGETVAVNTESQSLSTVVDQAQMENLPTLTRNAYDLVGTSGNVAEDSNSNRGAGYSINGQRSASTNILLDGAENVDLFTATVGQAVPLDSVQEFRVITSNFTAEYGRASGGVVNVATKSGTNKFTGSVYEFNRVSAISSNTYDNAAKGIDKPVFTRNQFGYAVGGPIKKDKMFVFSSTEWTRVRSNGTQTASILDPAFLALPGVATSTKSFMNAFGKIRPDAKVTQYVTLGQALNQAGTCDGLPCTSPFGMQVVYNTPSDAGGGTPQNTWNTVLRYDYNISNNTTFFARYAAYHEFDFAGSLTNSPYVGYDTPNKNLNQNIAVNLTHIFNPNFISSSKISYNRLHNQQPLGDQPVGPTLYTSNLGLPNLRTTNGAMVFPGYSAFTPGNAIPFGGPQNLLQFYEDISINKGSHQFKFGGSYINTHDNRMFGAYESAVESLSTTASLTPAISNLISGNIAQFQGAANPQGKYPCQRDLTTGALIPTAACTVQLPVGPPSFSRNFQYNDGAFYAQDAWKFKPRLTINYGIRWEYFGVQHNADPNLDSNFYLGTGANKFEQVRNGQVYIANQSPVGSLWAPRKQNWAPRVGFAWDIFGNGKTSLRGGYGISYERNFNNVTYNIIQNPPNYAVISLVAGSDITSMPIYTDNFGPLAGTGTKALPAASLRAVDPHMKTAYAQFWSASLDRELFKNALLSVEYSASKGSRLYSIANYNVSYFGSTFLGDARAANRLNQQYSNINWRGSDGWSKYNGMNVRFAANNMFNKGLSLNVNYTWSHAMDNLSSAFSDGTPGNFVLGYTNAFFPSLDNGNADFDVRHRFVLSGVWEVPWGNKMSSKAGRMILGGWSLSPIVNIRTGFPYSVWDCYGGVYNCPRWAPGQAVALKGGRGASVGTNLFSWLPLPLDSTGSPVGMGNASDVPTCTGLYGVGCSFTSTGGYPERNQFVGPNYWNTNMVIGKNFKLNERFNLQFRAEMYNVWNHHNDYIQGGSNDASSITEVTSSKGGYGNATDERRNVQFGLKLNF